MDFYFCARGSKRENLVSHEVVSEVAYKGSKMNTCAYELRYLLGMSHLYTVCIF